jgi:signal transduction histidine kinase
MHRESELNTECPNIILFGKKQKLTAMILMHLQNQGCKTTHFLQKDELIKNLGKFDSDLLIYIDENTEKNINITLKKIKNTHPAILIFLISAATRPAELENDFYINLSDFKNEQTIENNIKNILSIVFREKNYTNLSSMILHDLRSPVQSISGYLDLLGNGIFGEINEGQSQIIRNTSALSEKLIDLLDDLNKIYLFEINKFELVKIRFQLKDIIDNCLRSIWIQSDQKNIKLVHNIDSNLPEILADPDLLQRVIINLVTNAIKYCPEKGTIRIYVQQTETINKVKMINFRVSDTGPGIPSEDIQFIFDKFYRANKTKNKSRGFGLGLYIAKLIIEAHNGQIGAYNNREGGATFYFNIPLKINKH